MVYGCNTLEEHMEAAVWDINLHALKGRHEEAVELFDSVLALEDGDMTGCTEVMLTYRALAPVAYARQNELAARGVDVEGLRAVMESARILRVAARNNITLDLGE